MKTILYSVLLLSAIISNLNAQNDSIVLWTKIIFPTTSPLTKVFFDPNGGLIASTEYAHYRSTNGGKNWVFMNNEWKGSFLFITPNNEIISYGESHGFDGRDLFYSKDYGHTWNSMNYHKSYGSEIESIFYNHNNNGIYINWYNYYSNNYWTNLTTNLGLSWTTLERYAGDMLLVSDNLILNDRFEFSSDNALTWIKKTNPFDNSEIYMLDWAIDRNKNIYIAASTGVYKANYELWDWSIIWQTDGLTNIAIRNDQVYVGFYDNEKFSKRGVYKLDNDSNEWINVNEGLDDFKIEKLFFDAYGYLYLKTHTQLFRKGDISSLLIPESFSLSQNFPNPFNPSTTIKYSIPFVGARYSASPIVLLKIYDVLGSEIATLVNEEKAPGNYEIVFNGVNLPSGIYFYKMSCGNFSETKKLVLMK
jgi:hypothetical protein